MLLKGPSLLIVVHSRRSTLIRSRGTREGSLRMLDTKLSCINCLLLL